MGTAAPTGARDSRLEWEAPGNAGSSWNAASRDFGGISADSGPLVGSGWFSHCGMILFPAKPNEGTAGKTGEERFLWEFGFFWDLLEESSETVLGGRWDSCSWEFGSFWDFTGGKQ